MDSKINVIINGYPKSGTTWLTKLVGDLLNCPVEGFWQYGDDYLTTTGTERVSTFACYKSHHNYEELVDQLNQKTKLIYIIRDPRDIVVSGAYHFSFLPVKIKSVLRKMIKSQTRRIKINHQLSTLIPLATRKSMMIDLVNGQSDYQLKWMTTSWMEHLSPFVNNNNYILRYEDLLQDTTAECRRILDFLDYEVSSIQLSNIVRSNTFDNQKQQFAKSQDYFNSRLLRKGKHQQWIDELESDQIDSIIQNNLSLMSRLGYLSV
jgi:hypothetical protein